MVRQWRDNAPTRLAASAHPGGSGLTCCGDGQKAASSTGCGRVMPTTMMPAMLMRSAGQSSGGEQRPQ